MEQQTNFIIFLLLLFSFTTASSSGAEIVGENNHQKNGSVKLFVFGDSYADTGNLGNSANSWKKPYGFTFPGKPGGRFSDGRVLTDFVASYLGIKSPVPFRLRKFARKSRLQYGMNFAYGGTGVFKTSVSEPNMTTQIDFFQKLLEEKVYTKKDLDSSIALVSLAGNDYAAYLFTNGSLPDLPSFSEMLIKQLGINLKRIQNLGVRKIAVTGIEPIGCLPALTAQNSYQSCIKIMNSPSKFHNQILKREVKRLNKESSNIHQKSAFVILNLYKSFWSSLKKKHHKERMKFKKNALKPCCVGLSSEYSCASVDDKGEKKYSVCKHPELSFFWDTVHPSQSGWHAVYLSLRSSLHRLYK